MTYQRAKNYGPAGRYIRRRWTPIMAPSSRFIRRMHAPGPQTVIGNIYHDSGVARAMPR